VKKPTIVKGSSTDRIIRWAALAVFAIVVVALPYTAPPFRVFQFTVVIIFAIATLGLNMLTGYNGQISLGHGFFFAVGAYTSGILVADQGWPFLVALLPAFALTFALGFLFGIPALRLEGLYLALVTLALAVVTPPLIRRFGDLTGGSQGMSVPKPQAPDWTGLATDQWQYFLCLAVGVVMFLVAHNLLRGRVGRGVMAIRDNHIAAETMGVNPAIFKTLIFAYSAAFAGVAGGLFSFIVGFLSPESFTLLISIEFLAAAVVGGLATIFGPILGALFTRFMPVYAADFNDAAPGVLYGIALILIMFLMPGGAMGLFRRIRAALVDYRVEAITGDTTPVAVDAGVVALGEAHGDDLGDEGQQHEEAPMTPDR
jgi:branched-chain amino acid transport system permease protein